MLLVAEEAVLTQTLILLLPPLIFGRIPKCFDVQFALFNSSPEPKFTYICLRSIVNRPTDPQTVRHIGKQMNTKKKSKKPTLFSAAPTDTEYLYYPLNVVCHPTELVVASL